MFEKEAEEYVCGLFPSVNVFASGRLIQAFKDGAKFGYKLGLEAGRLKWHDLRKNPDDLPTDKHFKITSDGDIALYDLFLGKWYDLRSDELTYQPAAWTEIPKLEEVEGA